MTILNPKVALNPLLENRNIYSCDLSYFYGVFRAEEATEGPSKDNLFSDVGKISSGSSTCEKDTGKDRNETAPGSNTRLSGSENASNDGRLIEEL